MDFVQSSFLLLPSVLLVKCAQRCWGQHFVASPDLSTDSSSELRVSCTGEVPDSEGESNEGQCGELCPPAQPTLKVARPTITSFLLVIWNLYWQGPASAPMLSDRNFRIFFPSAAPLILNLHRPWAHDTCFQCSLSLPMDLQGPMSAVRMIT